MNRPVLQIIVGSTRPGRAGSTVAEWFHGVAVKHDHFATQLVELADIALPLLDEPHHPRLGRYEHDHTRRWSQIVSAADAYVFAVPEYNHGYNAATKNALDCLHREWQYKPVGFVSYGGGAGGARAVQGLEPVVATLRMVASTQSVTIPQIGRLVKPGEPFTPGDRAEQGSFSLLDDLTLLTRLLAPMHRSPTGSGPA